jgi:hypothetical protein
MTRKRLVSILSIIYIVTGVWDLGIFLSRLVSSSRSIELDLAPLIVGTLALYIGFYLFRFDEFGRKLAIFLLYIRVAINAAFMVWAASQQEEVVGSSLYFLQEQIYHIENPVAFQVFLAVWIMIAILVIVFLSHKGTKELFSPKPLSNSGNIIGSA